VVAELAMILTGQGLIEKSCEERTGFERCGGGRCIPTAAGRRETRDRGRRREGVCVGTAGLSVAAAGVGIIEAGVCEGPFEAHASA